MADTTKHDQDALDPKSKPYEVDGKKYTLKPPKLVHLGRIMWISGLFNKAQAGTRVPDDDMIAAEAELDKTVDELTVEDSNAAAFTIGDKMDILGKLTDMIGTADQKALAEKNMKQSGKAAASGSPS